MTRITLYDTTLRDGAQTMGVDFSLADKRAIALALDGLGIDLIEAGWPGANPADSAFFADLPPLRQARFAAFGMTRRAGQRAADDPGLASLLATGTPLVCIVAKTSAFHVRTALDIEQAEALAMITESVAHLVAAGRTVLVDAEHYFDGYLEDPAFSRACVAAAVTAGARWVVLCDTNGGRLPHEIAAVVGDTCALLGGGERIGIHCHDDTGHAVANSIAAVRAGARQVQGTLNGLGERCGNANLITLLPTLMVKLGYETGVKPEDLAQLTALSRLVDERLNRAPNRHAPYVGSAAFAHKAGLHISALGRDSRAYEHIDPAVIGNERQILVSDQAGRATLLWRLGEMGIHLDPEDRAVAVLLAHVKHQEASGYAYDGAAASFELAMRRLLGRMPAAPFRLDRFQVVDERRIRPDGAIETVSEATVEVEIDGAPVLVVARGDGPVNALDTALREALVPHYPILAEVRLSDYKVRILTPEDGTRAVTRVMIESRDRAGNRWSTVGVAANVIDASYRALEDSLIHRLIRG